MCVCVRLEQEENFVLIPRVPTEAHKERKMQFVPSLLSVSESYMFVALSETTLLKYWCLSIEIFDDLELYINLTCTWSEWRKSMLLERTN